MERISRREFVRVSSLVTAATIAAACAQPTATPEPEPTATTAAAATAAPTTAPTATTAAAATSAPAATATDVPVVSMYSEAPMLAELVASGDLPPVDERLPENPEVVPVIESVGKYGGSIRRGFKGVSDKWGPTKMVRQGMTCFNFDLTLRPSFAESYELNEDGSEWTWHLRKGVRWSDGSYVTSADFMWYYDYQLLNETLTPTVPGQFSTGNPAVLSTWSAPDDYTVVMSFANPKPFLGFECVGHSNPPYRPSEYMKQFHPDFVDMDTLTAMAEAEGFSTWDLLYADRDWWYMDENCPCIFPWKPLNTLDNELFLLERNPYYWQVDSEGQQLPYIDKVSHRLFETPDVFNMWIVNGEIDFQGRHVDKGNYTLFKENESAGSYRVAMGVSASHTCFTPNIASQDANLREFFGTTDVRIAISLAMNRDEMNDLVFDGQGTPRQYSPLSMSPQAYPDQANAYIDYDPEQANALLDGAGYDQKDADGFRMYKDGSGLIDFTIEGTAEAGTADEDAILLMIGYLENVGIKCQYKYSERSLYTEHYESNQVNATSWGGDRTVMPIITPTIFDGTTSDRPWAGAFGLWRNDPTDPNAEEPPADHWIWTIWDAVDAINIDPDEDSRNTRFRTDVLDVWKEELPMIGLLGEFPALIIVKDGLINYVDGFPNDDKTKDEHVQQSQTLYWTNPEDHTT